MKKEAVEKLLNAFKNAGIELNAEDAEKIVSETLDQDENTVVAKKTPVSKNVASIVKNMMGIETNANEVMHTGNTGFGAELKQETQSDGLVKLAVEYSRLLPFLKGKHRDGVFGQAVSILGRAGLMTGKTERTASPTSAVSATSKAPTGKITITQGSLEMIISLPREMILYSTVENLEAEIYAQMGESAGRTIDALIVNADSASSGNVNGTVVSGSYYLQQAKGLRKEAISGTDGTDKVSMGTLSWADLVSLRKKIKGVSSAKTANLIWVVEETTWYEICMLEEYKNQSQNGKKSTINGIEIDTLLGSPVVVIEDFPLTGDDGKVSATAGDNVKGSILLFEQSVIQYAFGQNLTIDTQKVLNNGVDVGGVVDFGFALANKKAGETSPRVVLGYNITLTA